MTAETTSKLFKQRTKLSKKKLTLENIQTIIKTIARVKKRVEFASEAV